MKSSINLLLKIIKLLWAFMFVSINTIEVFFIFIKNEKKNIYIYIYIIFYNNSNNNNNNKFSKKKIN